MYSFAGLAEYCVVPTTAVFALPTALLDAGLYEESCTHMHAHSLEQPLWVVPQRAVPPCLPRGGRVLLALWAALRSLEGCGGALGA